MLKMSVTGLATFALVMGSADAADIRVTGQIVSEYAAGPPFQVNSITKVLNLNADRVDGMSASEFASAADLATADSGIDVHWKNIVNLPVTEIDQDCALSGGCDTGSDSSGFPVTITQAGSYRLASNLSTSSENATLISIQVNDVMLDLNGFTLGGPVTCSGTPVVSCSPSGGSGVGVSIDGGTGVVGARIFNGSIEGMGDHGIECLSRCTLTSLIVSHNGGDGINGGGVINQVRASYNGTWGINSIGAVTESFAAFNGHVGINGSTVANVTAQNNGSNGISGDVVSQSTAFGNSGHGISLNVGGAATANRARGNDFNGIDATSGGATVKGNSAYQNDQDGISITDGTAANNTVYDNGRYGFRCEDCMLLENTSIRGSTNFQDQGVLFAGTDSVWGRNMVNDHTTDFSGTVADMGGNFCDGSAC